MNTLFTPDFSGEKVEATGRFRICSLEPLPDASGYQSVLSNCMHSISAIIPNELVESPDKGLDIDMTISVYGTLLYDPIRLVVDRVSPAMPTIDLLPEMLCSADNRKLLQALVDEVSAFHPFVQRFVENALSYQDQYARFLTNPASKDCHHATEAGLLQHSLEVVSILKKLMSSLPVAEQICQDLVLALGLLHDLGKCYSGIEYQDGNRPPHDDLTLNALSKGIAFLEVYWPTGAEFTKYVFGHGWRQASPSCPEIIAIRLADQLSASSNARDRAFVNLPALFWYAPVEYLNGSQRTFRRLLPPMN